MTPSNETPIEESNKHLDVTVDKTTMPNLVIITGMSGAGRTEAMHVFEDMGYFCVDNLPAPLIADLVDLRAPSSQEATNTYTAVVCDARNHVYFESLDNILRSLDEKNIDYRVVFLDAADEKLVSRYKSSRRRHPLCDDGSSIGQGIQRERMLLSFVAKRADYTIDTTDMLPAQLHNRLRSLFGSEETRKSLSVSTAPTVHAKAKQTVTGSDCPSRASSSWDTADSSASAVRSVQARRSSSICRQTFSAIRTKPSD